MKVRWRSRSLGDLCRVVGGGTPSKDRPEFYSGDIPWATVRDMRADVIADTEYKITKAAVAASATNIIPAGNVVIATRVGLGKVCRVGQDTAINQDLRGIIPINPEVLSVRYLFWWLKSMAGAIVAEGTGATVQGVKLPFVKALQVPLPPVKEQERIVGVLGDEFAAIATVRANTEQNRRNATELPESYLGRIVMEDGAGWAVKGLGEWVDGIATGPFGSLLHKSDYEIGGLPLVNPINIQGDRIVPDSRKAVGKETGKRLARYALLEGDIVIARRGEIGRCAVVTRAQSGWLCGTGCFVIRPSNLTDPRFLAHLLRSRPYRRMLESLSARATMPSISNGDLGRIAVALPPVAEQIKISNLLIEMSTESARLVSIYQRKLGILDQLKDSILHRAFAGAL